MQKKWSKKTSNSSLFSSEEKLSFCEECGGLMLPTKIGKNISFKCKCGSTKPFFENSTNSYKVTRKIKHSVNEESIYGCFCGKKFNSHSAFLEHSNTCQNHINVTQIIKTKSKEHVHQAKKYYEGVEQRWQEHQAKKFLKTLIENKYILISYYSLEPILVLKEKTKCDNCGREIYVKDYVHVHVKDYVYFNQLAKSFEQVKKQNWIEDPGFRPATKQNWIYQIDYIEIRCTKCGLNYRIKYPLEIRSNSYLYCPKIHRWEP